MPIKILMPALSPTMLEGNLAKWHKKEGDKIKAGQVIAEIETDKATMEVEAVDEGILGKILVPAGSENVKVNEIIALILEDGESEEVLKSYNVSTNKAEAKSIDSTPTTSSNSNVAEDKRQKQEKADDRVFASPLAKRVASEMGADLSKIQGTGPHGRIIRDDVLESGQKKMVTSAPMFSPAPAFGRNSEEGRLEKLNIVRRTIAKRLQESKQNIPHFYLNIECNLDNLLLMRKQINDSMALMSGDMVNHKVSVNDFVIMAVAKSLKQVPDANASWTDDGILYYNNIDVSVAVAIDGGLITPIIKNGDQKSLLNISLEMKDLAQRARSNSLRLDEFQGGGFTISNLGMYGIKNFNAIINPPQSCILAIGAGELRPVIKDGEFAKATVMDVTLSSDHRVVDGAVGANFLKHFKLLIENPSLLLL